MIYPVKINNTTFQVETTPDFWFWPAVNEGRWEPHTIAIMDRVLKEDWRFVDIGAWIGPTTLYAATKCAVNAYECDPVALRALKTNLNLNPELLQKIHLHEFGLGSEDGYIKVYSQNLGNSETSIYSRHERNGIVWDRCDWALIGVRDVRDVFREMGYANCDKTFIKIDVEGAEYEILPRLKEIIPSSRCFWYVSFHQKNINPELLPSKYARISETIRMLSLFEHHNWYRPDFLPLHKEQVLETVLAGCEYDSLIFCHGDIPS